MCEEVAKGVEAAGGEAQVVWLLGKKIFRETADWLDSYFAERPPAKLPRYRIDGLTPFREMVVEEMLKIPFGKTASYGDIATRIAKRCGRGKISAQAVGGAVGWNPLCVMIPCHRVVGSDGLLVGYGGGLLNKAALLAHEARNTHRSPGGV